MKILLVFILIFLISSIIFSFPNSLNFNVNQEIVYKLNGFVDSKGKIIDKKQESGGSYATINSTLAIKMLEKRSNGFLFIMNMFDTNVDVGQKRLEKKINQKRIQNSNPLGRDMYFLQSFAGEILTIWYNTGDDYNFVQIKASAINSLQTTIVGVGEQKREQEKDPIGQHFTNFYGASGERLIIKKQFNQMDVLKYVDPNISKNDMLINGETISTIDNTGFIFSADVKQDVSLVSSVGNDFSGLDMNLNSFGDLSITYFKSMISYFVGKRFVKSDDLIETDLFQISTMLTSFYKGIAPAIENEDVEKIVDGVLNSKIDISKEIKQINQLIDFINSKECKLDVKKLLEKYYVKIVDKTYREKLFYLSVRVNQEGLIINFIKSEANEENKIHAILSLIGIRKPSIEAINVVYQQFGKMSQDSDLRSICILTYGTLASYFDKKSAEYKSFEIVLDKLYNNAQVSGDVNLLLSIIGALKNMGAAIPSKKSLRDEDYPYNKNFTKEYDVGGSTIEGIFKGELFIGTNFDCKQDTFNYKGLAQITADVKLFGTQKNAFEAKAVYAKKGGITAEDDIHLSVFEKIIYQKKIGSYVDCISHTYEIYHYQHLFKVEKVVFISIVPVVFKAGVDLKVDVNWDWKVCTGDLSAMVELVPAASLIIYGSAEINLIIVKAGVELDGSFDVKLIPQAYVHGTKCLVGMDLILRTEPMNIDFFAYYAVKKCKFIFIECKWQQQHNFDIFKWSLPKKEEIIFSKEWQIIKP